MTAPSSADSIPALTQSVSLQFASHPTFEQIAQRMLEQAIKRTYPWLDIDLSTVQLATPDATGRAWQFQPFMPVVLNHLAVGTPVDFSPRGNLDCFLSDTPPHRLRAGNQEVDIQVIKNLLLELAWSVPLGLEDALVRYWGDDIDATGANSRSNRWRWLGDVLRNMLSIRGLQQPGLADTAREALDQVVRWPDRERRFCLDRQAPV